MPNGLLSAWHSVWLHRRAQQRRSVTLERVLARPAVAFPRERWNSARGMMTGVVATRLGLGWTPPATGRWPAPSKEQNADVARDDGERREVAQGLSESAKLLVWNTAADRNDGVGLGTGGN